MSGQAVQCKGGRPATAGASERALGPQNTTANASSSRPTGEGSTGQSRRGVTRSVQAATRQRTPHSTAQAAGQAAAAVVGEVRAMQCKRERDLLQQVQARALSGSRSRLLMRAQASLQKGGERQGTQKEEAAMVKRLPTQMHTTLLLQRYRNTPCCCDSPVYRTSTWHCQQLCTPMVLHLIAYFLICT
jgi:hypothetical protein